MINVDVKKVVLESNVGDIVFNGFIGDNIILIKRNNSVIVNGSNIPVSPNNIVIVNDPNVAITFKKISNLIKYDLVDDTLYIWISSILRKLSYENSILELEIIEYFNFIDKNISLENLEKELLKPEYKGLFVNGNNVMLDTIIEAMIKGIDVDKFNYIKEYLHEIPTKILNRIESVVSYSGLYVSETEDLGIKYVTIKKKVEV